MNSRNRHSARRVALLGVLFALAAVLSLVETGLSPVLGLPPGVKPGLSNTVVMVALLFLGFPQAVCLAVLKAGLSLLVRGAMAGALSLCGGLFSVAVMWLVHRFFKPTCFIFSASGALAHNMGQLLLFCALWGAQGLQIMAAYLPVLILSGLCMGGLTALLLRALVPALKKMGFSDIIDNFYQ